MAEKGKKNTKILNLKLNKFKKLRHTYVNKLDFFFLKFKAFSTFFDKMLLYKMFQKSYIIINKKYKKNLIFFQHPSS